jgi:hypothetical protein
MARDEKKLENLPRRNSAFTCWSKWNRGNGHSLGRGMKDHVDKSIGIVTRIAIWQRIWLELNLQSLED